MRPTALVALLLFAGLALPPPGTTSRDRDFCRAWLALSPAERQQVLIEADARESRSEAERACRERVRPALRHKLDAECANWPKLMDFEVRQLVDAGLDRCRTEPGD